MKKTTVLLAAVLLSAVMARAEDASTTNTSVAAPASAAATSETATTSTTLSEASKEAPKKWSATLYNEIDANLSNVNVGNDRLDTLNFMALGYKTSEKTSVGVRQYFNYLINKDKKDIEADAKRFTMGNTMLVYNAPVPAVFGSDEIALQVRGIIPTSQESKDLHVVRGAQAIFDIPWTLNKTWAVDYIFWPGVTSLEDNVTNGRVINYAQLTYNLSDKLNFYTYGGLNSKFANITNTKSMSKTGETALLESGANWTMNKTLAFSLWVTQEGQVPGFIPFKDSESQYALATTVSF